ncbi:hypothetical protein HMSSN139_41780 [Paenibacillus sp. HMSSN-139]|nr:hypothetical protein HMSSN139_41780 [Paenibacillus sp. HMSSN-139]
MIDLAKLDEHRELFGFFAGQLVYPDKETFALIRESGEEVLPSTVIEPVTKYREQMLALSMEEIEELYVDTFDFEKSSTLYMTFLNTRIPKIAVSCLPHSKRFTKCSAWK